MSEITSPTVKPVVSLQLKVLRVLQLLLKPFHLLLRLSWKFFQLPFYLILKVFRFLQWILYLLNEILSIPGTTLEILSLLFQLIFVIEILEYILFHQKEIIAFLQFLVLTISHYL